MSGPSRFQPILRLLHRNRKLLCLFLPLLLTSLLFLGNLTHPKRNILVGDHVEVLISGKLQSGMVTRVAAPGALEVRLQGTDKTYIKDPDHLRVATASSPKNPYRDTGSHWKCSSRNDILSALPEKMRRLIERSANELRSQSELYDRRTTQEKPQDNTRENSHVPKVPGGMACPKDYVPKLAKLKDPVDFDKYKWRVNQGQCDDDRGMWYNRQGGIVRCKYEAITNLFNAGPGNVVVDFGTGCGHGLDWVAGQKGFIGIGLDMVQATVRWATSHMHHASRFCASDSTAFLPNRSVDLLFSNAALNNLELDQQCLSVLDMLRVLKVGRCSWHAWLGKVPDSESPGFFRSCFNETPGVAIATVLDEDAFGVAEHDDDAFSLVFCRVTNQDIKIPAWLKLELEEE